MTRCTSIALALLLTACQKPGQTELARGNVLVSQGKQDEALGAYRAAAAAAPRDPRPLELQGHVLFDLRRRAEARAAYEAALALDPAAIEALIGLARLDADEGKTDAALARLGQALQAQPDNLYALLSRANLAIRLGGPENVELAIRESAKAMTLDAKNPSVLSTRARAFLAAGKREEAEQAIALLARSHPDLALVPYERARLAASQGDRELALNLLKEARAKAGPQWRAEEVQADSAFQALSASQEFAEAIAAGR